MSDARWAALGLSFLLLSHSVHCCAQEMQLLNHSVRLLSQQLPDVLREISEKPLA